MAYSSKELELALDYAETAVFQAYLNPEDKGQVLFERTPLPEGISEELAEEIEFVADYYQRQIFAGDLDPEEPEPGWPEFEDVIAEINFKLKRFQSEFALEVRKSLGIEKHRQINPYARVMLEFQAENADYSKFKEKKQSESQDEEKG